MIELLAPNKNKKYGPAAHGRDRRTGGPFCKRYAFPPNRA